MNEMLDEIEELYFKGYRLKEILQHFKKTNGYVENLYYQMFKKWEGK